MIHSNALIEEKDRYKTRFCSATYKSQLLLLFFVLILFYLLLVYISGQFIMTEEIYLQSYSKEFTLYRIKALLDVQEQYWWLNYIFIPFILFFKTSFTTVCISIAIVLTNNKFKYTTIFKAVLLAEVIFILAQALYLLNLSFHLDVFTLQTASNYFPLSILSYYGTENVVQWLQYPLHTLNIFEVLYMIFIAWLLSKQWKQHLLEVLSIVIPSYGTGLILWLVFVTFLTLQIS